MSENRVFQATDALPTGFFEVDGEDRVQIWNRWLEDRTAIRRADILGRQLNDVFPEALKLLKAIAEVRANSQPLLRSQLIHQHLLPIRLPEGHFSGFEYMQQECHLVPIGTSAGSVAVTIRDVTSVVVGRNRLLALQKEWKDAKNAALRSTQIKTEFLNMMSHEIRTPLNAIHMFCLLLLDDDARKLDDEQRSDIEGIKRAAQDLTYQVNDLLDVGKIESGKLSVQMDEFTPAELFDSLHRFLRPLANKPGVNLVFQEIDQIGMIRTDQNKLSHILRNLVTNALKFTREGSVTVTVHRDGNSVVWTVKDTGIGIPAESLKRIFEDYYQVEGEMQRGVTGTGLGLSISRKLAVLLGGALSVESQPAVGSSFFLAIPVERLGIR